MAIDGARRVEIVIAREHPAFDGHLPGAPVLPGVVLLSEVLRAAGARQADGWRVEQAKFLGPVGPGSRLEIELVPHADGWRFDVRDGARAVASGRLGAPAGGGPG